MAREDSVPHVYSALPNRAEQEREKRSAAWYFARLSKPLANVPCANTGERGHLYMEVGGPQG